VRWKNTVGFTALFCLLSATAAVAQNRVVSGRIFDAATSAGVAGAQVAVVGGTQTSRADERGQFRITVASGEVILNVRALGFRRTQVRVPAGQETVEVPMSHEALQLTEVVVTGAATTMERRNVGTAVSTVSAAEIAAVPAPSIESSLQGKIVGAQINMNSGAPGGGGQIQIRGATSILGNGEPLYVVDGVIISNAAFSTGINAVSRASGAVARSSQDNAVNRLADISSNEIESIQVLKSAAASAIYGSKATNGVVIITTKRAHAGTPNFQLSQRIGQNSPYRLNGSRRWSQPDFNAAFGSGTNPPLSAAQLAQYCPTDPCPYFDYQGELYKTRGLANETSLSLGAGGENTRFFASVNDKSDPGTLLNTSARRQNLRINADQSIGSRWTAGLSAAIYRSQAARGISNNDNTFTSPMYGLGYTPAVVDLTQRVDGRLVDNTLLEALVGNGANPFQTHEGLKDTEDVWRQVGSAQIRFSALATQSHTLTFTGMGGFDRFDAEGNVFSPNNLQFEADDGFPGTAVQAEGLVRQFNSSLNGVHTFSPAPSGMLRFFTTLTTSAGVQYEDRAANSYSVIARGLFPGVVTFDQGTPTLQQTKTAIRDQAFYVGEEIVALDEKLSLSGRVRAERSSVNGDREKFYYWPAASVAYRFENLIPYTNEVKLRAAVGVSGNQARYGDRDLVFAPNGLIDGRNAIATPTNIGNQNIEPERMRETEFGVDATLWDSRVGLEASMFNRTITDMLLTAPLAPSVGFGSRIINGGEMETKGFELGLNITPIRTRDLQWTTGLTYYTFDSKIVSLPTEVADFVVANSGFGAQYGRGRIARGQPTTMIWANKYRADGSVVDTIVADANPDFTMSFTNSAQFRAFSLSALVDWRKGGFVSNMTQSLFDEGQNSFDYDDPSPDPSMTLGEYRYAEWNAGQNAGIYIQDGGFVKLREITLTYSLPTRLLTAMRGGAKSGQLVLGGRNLFTWTDYWSPDPEVNNFGNQNIVRFVDLAPYPPARSWFVGVNLSF
jgi:TonB-linked SusC/RagA family outer membrane protein